MNITEKGVADFFNILWQIIFACFAMYGIVTFSYMTSVSPQEFCQKLDKEPPQ